MEIGHKINFNSAVLVDDCLWTIMEVYEAGKKTTGVIISRFPIADILRRLINHETFANKYSGNVDEVMIINAFHLMAPYKLREYPEPYSSDTENVTINDYTRPFLAHGGFREIFEKEKKEDDFKTQLGRVNQSVIDTNKGIIITGGLSVLFAALAGIMSLLLYLKHDPINANDLQQIKKSIDSISLKIPKTDTVYIINPPIQQVAVAGTPAPKPKPVKPKKK